MNVSKNPTKYYLSLLGILILMVAIYLPTLKAYFIVDDFMWINIVGGKGWQEIPAFFTKLSGVRFFRPFIKLAFWFDYSLYGLNQMGYHLTNLILHACNIILAFCLCYILSKKMGIATLAALIFALHPMHTESISYISGRTELIHAVFFLTSLICFIKYIQGKEKSRGLYYGSLITFGLSLLTKETAVSLIVVFFLSELFLRFQQNEGRKWPSNWKKYTPYLVILISYIILRQFIIKANVYPIRYDAIWYRPIYYFIKIFTPVNVHSPTFITISQNLTLSIIIVLSLMLGLYGIYYYLHNDLKEQKPLLLYCLSWIVVIFFPVYFNPGERYAYLPSIGSSLICALIISQGIQKIKRHSNASAYVAWGAVIVGIVSFSYTRITERNIVFYKVGGMARTAISQLVSQKPVIPKGATLYFINPPEMWVRESEIWTRPFFSTFDDAVQLNYHDSSLKIYYNPDKDLTKENAKLSFLLKSGFKQQLEMNKEVLVFEYRQGNLLERTTEFKRLLINPT